MISISTGQLELWLAQYIWPFIRIGACFMAAPVFGAQFVPPRVRLLLAAAVTLIVAPLVPPPQITTFSAAGLVVTFHQVIIGVAIGFGLQLIFDALSMGGQLLSNTMGLGFAFNVDPLRGTGTPVLGQLYMLLVTLTFLAINGHLVLIEILAEGFTTLPVGTRSDTQFPTVSGNLLADLDLDYDYATLTPRFALSRYDLTPRGRELIAELAWRGELWGGDAAASVFWRKDPGHYADVPDDQGVAVRWSRGF